MADDKQRKARKERLQKLKKSLTKAGKETVKLPSLVEFAEEMLAQFGSVADFCKVLKEDLDDSKPGSQTRSRNLQSITSIITLGARQAQPELVDDELLTDEDLRRAQLDNLRDIAEGLGLNLDELTALQEGIEDSNTEPDDVEGEEGHSEATDTAAIDTAALDDQETGQPEGEYDGPA